jgi:hypothetical protein
MKRLSTEDFILKSNLKHGNVYDYSKTIYKNGRSFVTIICKLHGEFEQQAGSHVYTGRGCPKCGNNFKVNTKDFIEKAKLTHKNIYDYNKVEYVSAHKKVIITCKEHGDFLQTPNSHMKGNGCNECFRIRLGDLKRKTKEDFIKESTLIHKNKFDYSNVVYKTSSEKIEIICNNHGSFWQTANNHIQGHGCPKCISIVSIPEIELQNYIESLGFEIQVNKRNIIAPYELDIFIPKLDKGIEFNGEYWHYEKRNKHCKPKGYHAMKSNLCREKGIKLLHVREDLWNKDKEKMKQIINKFLTYGYGIFDHKI